MTVTVYRNGEQLNHFNTSKREEIFYNIAKLFYNKFCNPVSAEIEMDTNEILSATLNKIDNDDNGKQTDWCWKYTFENVLL
jgi:hypothetical protein